MSLDALLKARLLCATVMYSNLLVFLNFPAYVHVCVGGKLLVNVWAAWLCGCLFDSHTQLFPCVGGDHQLFVARKCHTGQVCNSRGQQGGFGSIQMHNGGRGQGVGAISWCQIYWNVQRHPAQCGRVAGRNAETGQSDCIHCSLSRRSRPAVKQFVMWAFCEYLKSFPII